MRRAPLFALCSALALALAAGAAPAPPASADGAAASVDQATQEPSRDKVYANTPKELVPYGDYGELHRRTLFPEPLPYYGPGAEAKDPEGLTRVDLGLLAPTEGSPDWRVGLSMTRGATLAVEQANAGGGYKGLPFHLIKYDDLPLWGASSNKVVKMAYEDKVWAAVGSVSGDSSHIAIRVGLKALLPIMNTATGDPTLTETGIPWAFRCIADSRQQGYALARKIFEEDGHTRVAVLRANSRYGRMGIAELRDAARRLGHPFAAEVNWLPATPSFDPLIERLLASRPDALVIWGEAELAGKALARARELGLTVPAYGPARVISDQFLADAGKAAEGFVAVSTFDPTSVNPAWTAFRAAYKERWDEEPDAYAAHAYDGMNLVLDAVQKGGLNRVRIRNALAAVERYQGATGLIVFDNTFNDVGPVFLATVENGAFHYDERPANGWKPDGDAMTIGLLRSESGPLRDAGVSAERGIRLAIAERGGRAGQGGPGGGDRLVVTEVTGPWTTASQFARDLMVRDGAVGVLTLLDHAGSHAAAQVATKLRRPMITVNDPSALLHYTGVPWVAGPPKGAPPAGFARAYAARFGGAPDADARAGYLAARELLDALEAGTERSLAPAPSPIPSSLPKTSRPTTTGSLGGGPVDHPGRSGRTGSCPRERDALVTSQSPDF